MHDRKPTPPSSSGMAPERTGHAAGERAPSGQRADMPEGGKLLPPRDPVDVPRQPPKPGADTPDEAARQGQPVRDNRDESNWADGSKPQPHAKNTRTHLQR